MVDDAADEKPLYQRRWFQVLLAVLVGLVVLSFVLPPIFLAIYELRSVLVPVLIGFGLAYVVHPVITYLNLTYRIPRWLSTAGIMFVGLLVVANFLLLVVPPLVVQGTDLILKLKEVYPQELIDLISEADLASPFTPDADPDAPDAPDGTEGTEGTEGTDGALVPAGTPEGVEVSPDPDAVDVPLAPGVTETDVPIGAEAQAPVEGDLPPGVLPAEASPAEAPVTATDGEEAADARAVEAADAPDTDAEDADADAVDPSTLSWRERLNDPQQRQLLLKSLTDRLRTLDWTTISNGITRSLDIGVGVVGSAISFTTYLLLGIVIVGFCFFYFAWKFNDFTNWFVAFIPASQYDTIMPILRRMDRSVNAFIRGRLIQAALMMIMLSIGWWFVGVPYWLLLGVLSGLLNLVPFLVVVGWIVATVLTIVDHSTGSQGFTLWTLLGPTAVYVFAQSFDGWIIEPVVQGKATSLNPLVVLLVVMIGGSLAGLLGMLIAIPTAACIKIAAEELVLPRLRELAAKN